MNNITKQIFQLVTSCNCDLHMQYVPSDFNEADLPSRCLSYSDACLNIGSWQGVERQFGPHSMDLMAIDSNVTKSSGGKALPYFTQYPTPYSSGVNLFTQDL